MKTDIYIIIVCSLSMSVLRWLQGDKLVSPQYVCARNQGTTTHSHAFISHSGQLVFNSTNNIFETFKNHNNLATIGTKGQFTRLYINLNCNHYREAVPCCGHKGCRSIVLAHCLVQSLYIIYIYYSYQRNHIGTVPGLSVVSYFYSKKKHLTKLIRVRQHKQGWKSLIINRCSLTLDFNSQIIQIANTIK